MFGASDTLRSEVPAALAAARSLGIRHIELLTSDNERAASALAEKLGVEYRANLLPEIKIDVVKEYQAKGHIVLMREDWNLVPDVLRIARRTMRIVKMNLAFTTVYNLVGLSLAAIGILPPVLAAAAQSLPDIGIMGNSARLLKQK